MSDKLPMTREQIEARIILCFPLWRIDFKERNNLLSSVENILRIGTTELREENKRLRGNHIECHQGRDIIESLSQAMQELPCCGIMGILAAATQEIDALRSGEFICKKCGLRKDADNFFKEGSIPF